MKYLLLVALLASSGTISNYTVVNSTTIPSWGELRIKKQIIRVDYLVWLDRDGKTIIRVDKDGDIFLRGKWIGWDGRFKDYYGGSR